MRRKYDSRTQYLFLSLLKEMCLTNMQEEKKMSLPCVLVQITFVLMPIYCALKKPVSLVSFKDKQNKKQHIYFVKAKLLWHTDAKTFH